MSPAMMLETAEAEVETLDHPVLRPHPDVPWAETMVLNPAVIDEPGSTRLHMLFRASGPWPQARLPGQPAPYPIFLGYACSDDGGCTWQADWSRPALAPAMETDPAKIVIRNRDGQLVVNHANGCLEDPRLFRLDGRLYCTTACRMFPPGPYWENDDPMQCAPGWARRKSTALGRAATENITVSVLWEVDLAALASHRYGDAFTFVTHLTDPELGDNRDVMLFPQTVTIDGRPSLLCLHRPADASGYGPLLAGIRPSIFIAAARHLEDFPTAMAAHRLLARPEFWWEENRIGASWGPIPLEDGRWLMACHGKLDKVTGYTQSFMILAPCENGWPEVVHRCPRRIMTASQPWEKEGLFTTPCVFTCGGTVLQDGRLLMTYGAADTVAGAAWIDLAALVREIEAFDANGNMIPLRPQADVQMKPPSFCRPQNLID